MSADTRSQIRLVEEAHLEHVRREVRLGSDFTVEAFEAAFDRFVQTYNVAPLVARCSPDVLDRYCRLFETSEEVARQREVRFRGIPVHAAILPAGTLAFEGHVDEDRMGDW